VFYLILGPAVILFCAWMAVREAGFAIRSRTFAPWAWVGFAVISIAVLLAAAGLNRRIAGDAAVPALILTVFFGWADHLDPQRYTKRDAARTRAYQQYASRKGKA
jgi:hypothetical protein